MLKPAIKKSIFISFKCIIAVASAAVILMHNGNIIKIQKNDSGNGTNPVNDAASVVETGRPENPAPAAGEKQSPANGVRHINIISVDRDLHNIVEKYAKEYWDFDYKIDYVSDEMVYSTDDLVTMMNEKLRSGDSELDIYCAPAAYNRNYIKGEYSKYACTYKELGINVDAGLENADIPQYVIDDGTNPDGEITSIPYMANACIFMYRRSVAKDVWGTDDPDRIAGIIGAGTGKWDKFMEAAKTLKEHGYYIIPGSDDLTCLIDTTMSSPNPGLTEDNHLEPAWEEFMDTAKFLFDNGYIKDTRFWTDQWYKDLAGHGDKVFGLATVIDLYQYLDLGRTAGDWAICMPPVCAISDVTTGIMVSKNSPNKDILGPLIEWITLDCSKTGFQYRLASGTFKKNEKISVISGTVLKTVDGSREVLGGQNINPLIYDALRKPFAKHQTYGPEYSTYYAWINETRAYQAGEKGKETAIADFMAETGLGPSVAPEPPQGKVIVWKDKFFEGVVRDLLKKPTGDIYESDIGRVTELNLDVMNLDNIEDIAYFNGLRSLSLFGNQISDISGLKKLPNLEVLNLCGNKISDIGSLAGLTNLKELDVSSNKISDIGSLNGLKNLEILNICANGIIDIRGLAGLTGLKELIANCNEISDISSLKGLTSLEVLKLGENKTSDIRDLGTLTNLYLLMLDNNGISDISVLKKLTGLEELYLEYNKISDIRSLEGLSNLEALHLDHNEISEISSFNGLTSLETLDMSVNKIDDIRGLSGLTDLSSLEMANNEISDISALGELKKLKYLNLSANKITDISSLSRLTNLEDVDLAGNEIKDISPVKHVQFVTWYH